MANNQTVSKAKANKQDEFYTQLSDISNELTRTSGANNASSSQRLSA